MHGHGGSHRSGPGRLTCGWARKRARGQSNTCSCCWGRLRLWRASPRSFTRARTGRLRAWPLPRFPIPSGRVPSAPWRTSLCIERARFALERARCLGQRAVSVADGVLREESGQASVEAALLLPSLMVCMALLTQPVCILYTRCVMQAAAAEACRLMATEPTQVNVAPQAQRDYVLRRLVAVPNADVFHVGGEAGWTVELEGSTGGHAARARIATSVRPLPLVGVLPALLGKSDGAGNVLLEVEVETVTRPEWLEGSYGSWASTW